MKLGKKKDPDAPKVRVAAGTYQRAMIKKTATQITLVILAFIFIYLCFAATIVRVVPSSSGLIPLKNNTFPGGQVPVNTQVLVKLDEENFPSTSIGGKLGQSFIPQKPTALVSVLAGPTGEVKWTGGTVTVSGKPVAATFPTDPQIEFLQNQYIAVCITGDCTPGTAIVFVSEQVLGVPFKQNEQVPPPAPLSSEGKVNRNDPLEVVGAYLVEGYGNNADLACGLLESSYLKSSGGGAGCAQKLEDLKVKLGPRYDFNKGMSLKLKSEADGKIVVNAKLAVARGELESSFTLVPTAKGLAITAIGTENAK